MAANLIPRLLYYYAVIGGAVVVHQAFFASIFGEDIADFFRRNSEAYVLMILVPAYWDRFGLRIRFASSDHLRHLQVRPGLVQQAGWIGGAALVGILLQVDAFTEGLGVPQSLVTLSEGFLAAAIVALWLGWTRRLFVERRGRKGVGAPRPRPMYYLVVFAFAVIAHQNWAFSGLTDVATDNIETVAAALVLPAYFDWVYDRSLLRLLVWTGLMVVVPVLSQPGVLDGGPIGSLTGWLVRGTEAFLAGLVIAWYYRALRSARPAALRLP